MIHYFCTIVFNNTSDKGCEDGNGLRFYVEVVAEDMDNARSMAEITAENMCDKIFQNRLILSTGNIKLNECDYGHSSIQPLLGKPTFTIDVREKEIMDDWGDYHDKRLRKAINEIWANDNYRDSLYSIVRAYYERDSHEIAANHTDGSYFSKADELSFDEFLDNCDFESLCYEMFSHILDDEDLRAIINFIRPKLSFVNNWWEV